MRRFRFPLEGYLKLKKMLEEQKLNELQSVIAKRRPLEEDIEKSQREMERILNEERMEVERGEFQLNLALLRRNYLASLKQKAKLSQKKLEDLKEEWEQKKQAWQKARLDRLALEKWRDRYYQNYLYETKKEEIKDLDEFNLKRQNLRR